LIKKAKEMSEVIKNLLQTHIPSSPLPRANDKHIISSLTLTPEDDPITEINKSELASYFVAKYPRLRDITHDAPSLLHDTIEFVFNYKHKIKGKD
jgi:hypothetical protein